jgi:flagellar FliL protein
MADKQNEGKSEKELGNIDEDEMSTISQIESSKKKGGGIKKLLFILIPVVILLGGGGFAAYHFLLAKPKVKVPLKPVNVSTIKPGPMMNLKPFLTNLADKDKTSYIKVSISIELKQGSNIGTFKQLVPQIRNSIIMIMSSKTSREINTPQGILSLRHQIARGLNRILGDGTVTGVYFNDYLVQ